MTIGEASAVNVILDVLLGDPDGDREPTFEQLEAACVVLASRAHSALSAGWTVDKATKELVSLKRAAEAGISGTLGGELDNGRFTNWGDNDWPGAQREKELVEEGGGDVLNLLERVEKLVPGP